MADVFAIIVEAYWRNAARRDNALSALNTRFQLPQWGSPEARPLTARNGDPGLLAISRFVSEADRDALWADLDQAFGTGVNGPVSGSIARRHRCGHPDGNPCMDEEVRVF